MRKLLLLAAIAATPATLHAQKLGIAPLAGTLGPGIDLAYQIAEPLNVRAGVRYLTISREYQLNDFDKETDVPLAFKGDADFVSAALMADYHPFKGGFRLSAGALYNNNQFGGSGRMYENYSVGERQLTPEEVGTLDVKISFPKVNGYAGLGFGNVAAGKRRFGFMMDLGMLYQGPPKAELTCTGAIEPTCSAPATDPDTGAPTGRTQAAQFEKNLGNYQFFPVLNLGLTVRILR